MKQALRKVTSLSIAALCFGLAAPLAAQVVLYDNSVNDLVGRFSPSPATAEVGNEITLSQTGDMQYFSFKYLGDQYFVAEQFFLQGYRAG